MRWLLWLCVLAALIDLRAFGLTDLDEGFYASVAWEMRQSGDWRTPTFTGQPWFEKPPLLYWLMLLSMRLFGENEFAVRLPSAVMYGLTIGLLAWWGNRRLGQGAGTWGALLFAIAPLSLMLARLAITDMTLTFLLTVALIALWEARGVLWSALGGVALGLAVLTKGPVGLGLVGLLYLWNARLLHARGLRFRWVLLALLAALLTALPWYVGIYWQHGAEFFNEFVVRQNLLRFAGGDRAHSVLTLFQRGDALGIVGGAALYLLFYVVVLWPGGLPLIGYVGVLWAREDDALRLYLRRWAWLVFGLFTLSFTKLPAYIFPMLPALALLAGARIVQARLCEDTLAHHPLRASWWNRLALVVGAAFWAAIALYAPLWQSAVWVVALAAGMPLAVLALAKPAAPPWTRTVGIVLLLVGWNGALVGYDRLALKPVRDLALKPPPYRTLILYRVHPGYPSVQFYRGGRYATSDNPDATMQRMRQEGAYCLTTDAAFTRRDAVFVLAEAQVFGKRFYLTAPRYGR
ncbi:MAG: glycosyltransferase family 39 protein [Fimbriimonadales bacterium]|nr:glycosyltransferase family 39 protein [Fimbriimonadales bacterium]